MEKKTSITELFNNYLKAISRTEKCGEKVGQALTQALKSVIPDIEYSIGWAEAGVDTICLWSEKYKAANMIDDGTIPLREIMEEVFGEEFCVCIDCPFGIWLPPDTAKKAKEVLTKLRKESKRGEKNV